MNTAEERSQLLPSRNETRDLPPAAERHAGVCLVSPTIYISDLRYEYAPWKHAHHRLASTALLYMLSHVMRIVRGREDEPTLLYCFIQLNCKSSGSVASGGHLALPTSSLRMSPREHLANDAY